MNHIDFTPDTPSISPLKLNTQYLAQADLLLLAARLFRPPSVALQDLAEVELSEVTDLLHHSGIPEAEQLIEIFQQTLQQLQSISLETWSGEYYRLFDCGVLCSMNESGFVRRDKGAILADVAGFYRAFGFQLSEQTHEKVDHLLCELEFVAMLFVMLAKAHDQETSSITYDALAAFSADHLGEWIEKFCERLTQTTSFPFYQYLAKLLSHLWLGMVQIHHLPSSGGGPLESNEEEDGTPYECGMAEKMVM